MEGQQNQAISAASRFSYDIIPKSLVGAMRAALPSSEKEVIMETFGISSNTWAKVRNGAPIRQSTAERLIGRLMHLGIVEDARV